MNFALCAIAWGTFFGTLNLILAVVNLFPLYQQDGWKSLMVISRSLFRRASPLVEWSFTLTAGLIGLILVSRVLLAAA
jgi:membrane-associated protease RseP (regulator of RpoE activity)